MAIIPTPKLDLKQIKNSLPSVLPTTPDQMAYLPSPVYTLSAQSNLSSHYSDLRYNPMTNNHKHQFFGNRGFERS
jgi:hypothetical protein